MDGLNLDKVVGDVGAGVTGGMMLGPVGAAAGGLIGLVTDLVPALVPHLFGKNTAAVQTQVKQVVASVTGGSTAPDDLRALIAADPVKAGELKLQLLQVAAQADQTARQNDLDTLKAQLADTSSARDQTLSLAKAGSAIAWGAPVISMIVLLTFGVVVWMAFHPVAGGADGTLLNVVLGTLGTMSTAVVSYWVGSSAGSVHKTELLARAPAITD